MVEILNQRFDYDKYKSFAGFHIFFLFSSHVSLFILMISILGFIFCSLPPFYVHILVYSTILIFFDQFILEHGIFLLATELFVYDFVIRSPSEMILEAGNGATH